MAKKTSFSHFTVNSLTVCHESKFHHSIYSNCDIKISSDNNQISDMSSVSESFHRKLELSTHLPQYIPLLFKGT